MYVQLIDYVTFLCGIFIAIHFVAFKSLFSNSCKINIEKGDCGWDGGKWSAKDQLM